MAILVANDGSRYVETIAERDAIPTDKRFMGMEVLVRDATADPVFGGGRVQYIWDKVILSWSPIWADKMPELNFATEDKTIVDGKVTADHLVKNNLVWCARVVNLEGVILGDAQVTVAGRELSLNTQDYNGMILHYTYAHGDATAELMSIWDSKANSDSPIFTGNPKAPTPDATSNDESLATTAFVKEVVGEQGTGIGEAPSDGDQYVRKDEAWAKLEIDLDTAKLKSSTSSTGALVVTATAQQTYVFTNSVAGTREISFANGPAGYMITSVLVIDGNAGDITFSGTNLKWNDNKVLAKADFGAARTVILFLWDGISTWVGSKGPAY